MGKRVSLVNHYWKRGRFFVWVRLTKRKLFHNRIFLHFDCVCLILWKQLLWKKIISTWKPFTWFVYLFSSLILMLASVSRCTHNFSFNYLANKFTYHFQTEIKSTTAKYIHNWNMNQTVSSSKFTESIIYINETIPKKTTQTHSLTWTKKNRKTNIEINGYFSIKRCFIVSEVENWYEPD